MTSFDDKILFQYLKKVSFRIALEEMDWTHSHLPPLLSTYKLLWLLFIINNYYFYYYYYYLLFKYENSLFIIYEIFLFLKLFISFVIIIIIIIRIFFLFILFILLLLFIII